MNPTILHGDHALTIRRAHGGTCQDCSGAALWSVGGFPYCENHWPDRFVSNLSAFRDEARQRAHERLMRGGNR